MLIKNIKETKEVEHCVDMYLALNDYSFMPANREIAIKNLSLAVRRNKFVKVLKMNDKIVSWIYADSGASLHMSTNIIQQFYYCSELKGPAAYKSVKLLHDALIDYAEKKGYELIISSGSHFDKDYTFTRILEKLGWERRGYIAVYKTSHYK